MAEQDSVVEEAQPTNPAQEAPDAKEAMQLAIQGEVTRLARTQSTDILDPIAYSQLKQVATDMYNSKAFPKSIDNPLQALMLMQAGSEMGMRPIEAVNSLYIVNGSINIWGKAIISRLTRAGYFIKYIDEQNKCTAVVTSRDKQESYEETVTFEDAEKSGYTKTMSGSLKPGWIDGINRRLKLRYQALSLILKTYLPHLLGSTAGIVEVNEDWEPKKYEIELDGKTLSKPSKKVGVPTNGSDPFKGGVASAVMEKVDESNN